MCTHTHTHTRTHTHTHTHAHTHTLRHRNHIVPVWMNLLTPLVVTVILAGQQPLTDPTVRTEVSPSQNHRVRSHPFPAQMACTSTPAASQLCTPRTPSVTSIPLGFPSSFMSPILQATPQSEHDSEPAAMPSGVPALHKDRTSCVAKWRAHV